MTEPSCPCGSGLPLTSCCAPLHQGMPASSAEALMRSRYSAYVLGNIDYLVASTLPAQQAGLDRDSMQRWSQDSQWQELRVEQHEPAAGTPAHARVTFVASWHDASGPHSHRERSSFVQHGGHWYFIDPTVPLRCGRNDPCPCGSGQKFKKCCADWL